MKNLVVSNWRVIIRFCICGGLSTAVDFTVYRILFQFLPPVSAKSISFFCGTVISFFLNRNWTFQSHGRIQKSIIVRFAVTQGINLTVNNSVNLLVLILTQHLIFAFICATACGMTVNFLLQRFWVFH